MWSSFIWRYRLWLTQTAILNWFPIKFNQKSHLIRLRLVKQKACIWVDVKTSERFRRIAKFFKENTNEEHIITTEDRWTELKRIRRQGRKLTFKAFEASSHRIKLKPTTKIPNRPFTNYTLTGGFYFWRKWIKHLIVSKAC